MTKEQKARAKREKEFEIKLARLINRHGIDADLATEDFTLASFLCDQLCGLKIYRPPARRRVLRLFKKLSIPYLKELRRRP